jgi:hypothetical protein
MLAKLARELPRGELLYEPKWDGFRCIVFRDGDDLLLQSRNQRPLDRYFPELLDPLRERLPARAVVDGELVVPRGDGLDFDAVFVAVAKTGTAIEINSFPDRLDLPDELVLRARRHGVRFAIDTDAHAPGQLDFQQYGCARAAEAGIDPERIINTWPVERLLEWARP